MHITRTALIAAMAAAFIFHALPLSAEEERGGFGRFKYRITDLGTLGGTESFAYAINDAGQIVGFSRVAGDERGESFLSTRGEITSLSPLNSGDILTVGPTSINNRGQVASGIVSEGDYYPAIYDTCRDEITVLGSLGGFTDYGFSGVATSINDSGQTVGYSYLDTVDRHAFAFGDGLMSDLGTLGEALEDYSGANAINNAGAIAGFSSKSGDGRAHAFLYVDGVMRAILPFADTESYAHDINNRGQVVGTFLAEGRSAFRAFLYSNGDFVDLGAAFSPQTSAHAINDSGEIVGIWFLPYVDLCFDDDLYDYVPCIKYRQQAFLYRKGRMRNLNALIPWWSGWDLTAAYDINNRGQIVGYGVRDGKFRAFLMTPRYRGYRHRARYRPVPCERPQTDVEGYQVAPSTLVDSAAPVQMIVEPESEPKQWASRHMRGTGSANDRR
jgi:probable HAF family extracellular repeat protein